MGQLPFHYFATKVWLIIITLLSCSLQEEEERRKKEAEEAAKAEAAADAEDSSVKKALFDAKATLSESGLRATT